MPPNGPKVNSLMIIPILTQIPGLVEQQNVAEGAISFTIACLTIFGYITWITYTAYGLSSFPIGILKGTKIAILYKLTHFRS